MRLLSLDEPIPPFDDDDRALPQAPRQRGDGEEESDSGDGGDFDGIDGGGGGDDDGGGGGDGCGGGDGSGGGDSSGVGTSGAVGSHVIDFSVLRCRSIVVPQKVIPRIQIGVSSH